MELYNFFTTAWETIAMYFHNAKINAAINGGMQGNELQQYVNSLTYSVPSKILWYALGTAFLLWLVFFLFQAFGLYTMAKNKGLKNRWLAFVPFASTWYIGKIVGECRFFNQKVKNAGVCVLVLHVLAFVATTGMIVSQLYLYSAYGAPELLGGAIGWKTAPTGIGKLAVWYFEYGTWFVVLIGMVYEIFIFVLMMGLLRTYVPKHHMLLSFLALFIPISRYIIIFVIRKRKAIDYGEYMRARREAYYRQQQQYYNQYGNGNPYGNPYNRPYGNTPYGNQQGYSSPTPNQPQTKPEDPFEEFASSNASAQGNGEKGGDTGDGFFD